MKINIMKENLQMESHYHRESRINRKKRPKYKYLHSDKQYQKYKNIIVELKNQCYKLIPQQKNANILELGDKNSHKRYKDNR